MESTLQAVRAACAKALRCSRQVLGLLGNRVKDDVAGGLGSEGEGMSFQWGWAEARQNGAYIRRGILHPSIRQAIRS